MTSVRQEHSPRTQEDTLPGYDPNCQNCFKCLTCRGDGTVYETRSDGGEVWKERVTCRTCAGRGGKPGAGMHDHG